VASANGVPLLNGVPASEDDSLTVLASVGTLSHLPVKAVQLNGSDPYYVADSVSNENPFRFYLGHTGTPLRSTLAWDRRFPEGLQPVLRNLNLFVYDPAAGTELASAVTPDGTVQHTELPQTGDLLIKA